MPSLALSCKPLPDISDHEIVFVELPNSTRICKLWHKADMVSIHEVITNFNNEFLHCITDTPVDALWNKFKGMCHVCLNKIPSKVVKVNAHHPWINQSIRRLTHRKQRAYNFARSNQCAEYLEWSTKVSKKKHKDSAEEHIMFMSKAW